MCMHVHVHTNTYTQSQCDVVVKVLDMVHWDPSSNLSSSMKFIRWPFGEEIDSVLYNKLTS